jgi:alanine racemase
MNSAKIELSRSNLTHNVQTFRGLLNQTNPNTKFCAVVKSNAYGHGIQEITKLCLESGVDVIGVNSLEEAWIVRGQSSSIPILIMGDIPNIFQRENEVSDPNFWILVSRLKEWTFLSSLEKRPNIHLKVDTGMGRLGYSFDDLTKIFSQAKELSLPLEGIATHFASTEDFTEHSYSKMQLEEYGKIIHLAEEYGFKNTMHHSAASASALLFDEARMDMVRVGISLYGLWPSIETKLSMNLLGRPKAILKPVLSWKSTIQHIKEVPVGSFIGYGSTYKTTYPTKVGVVPVGYYEGLDRKISNIGYMLVNGDRAKILGRICMNMAMIDLTHINDVELGNEVVIIGRSGRESITADDLSSWSQTINYEVVTRISPNLTRTIIE